MHSTLGKLHDVSYHGKLVGELFIKPKTMTHVPFVGSVGLNIDAWDV